jgi:hypothetical protein
MNGLLGKFSLEEFDKFFDNYKEKNILAQEALTAIEQFIPMLNEFLDLCDDLTEEMIINNTTISWYSYAIVASGDYIRAKSMYYNEASFNDVSINMSGEEIGDYSTDMGACFGKVCISLFNMNFIV